MSEMGRRTKNGRARSKRSWGVSLLVLAGLCGGLMVAPISAHAGKQLTRLSAKKTAIDGNAILLPSGTSPFSVSPIQVYSNSGPIPGGDNIVYVTISGEGLGTCDGIALKCVVDGANCVAGNAMPGTGVPNGWVLPLGDEFFEDSVFGLSGVNFKWCARVSKTHKNVHSVKIFGATEFGDCNTFLEGVHVYIDSNKINSETGDDCGTYPTPNPATSPD